MSEMIDKVRIAMIGVLQNSNLPVGLYIDTERLARAAIEELRNFDTSDYTFTEAEAIRRFIDAALGKVDA